MICTSFPKTYEFRFYNYVALYRDALIVGKNIESYEGVIGGVEDMFFLRLSRMPGPLGQVRAMALRLPGGQVFWKV